MVAAGWTYYQIGTAPTLYDVVWCNFPHDQNLTPGPKPRPGLVRRVLANPDFTHAAIEIAYGTSQIRDKVYAWDLLVTDPYERACAGLTMNTRFDLHLTKTLPWCSEFFSKRIPRRDGPIIGKLHEHTLDRLHKMIEENE